MRHFVIGDLHNDYKRFLRMLEILNISQDDVILLLGDIFDRSDYDPNPVDLYFKILSLGEQCIVCRGNHDEWLSKHIFEYVNTKPKKRKDFKEYYYNSFNLIRERLTDVDMLNLANRIESWPLQICLNINDTKYLFSHGLTSHPEEKWFDDYYLMGGLDEDFYNRGIDGFVSFCGHINTSNLVTMEGVYLREKRPSIWVNNKKNVYAMDCGCGFSNGSLSCYCIETGETFYV